MEILESTAVGTEAASQITVIRGGGPVANHQMDSQAGQLTIFGTQMSVL